MVLRRLPHRAQAKVDEEDAINCAFRQSVRKCRVCLVWACNDDLC